jgi:TatA/E family protein of Tat protein translocase
MHLLLVLAAVLIVFGPGRMPEVGAALGKSLRELRAALHEPQERLIGGAMPDPSPSPALPAPPAGDQPGAELSVSSTAASGASPDERRPGG